MYTADNPVEILGVAGSPYTRKMLAYLRFRRIPYKYLIGSHEMFKGYPKPKPQLFPTVFLPDEEGTLQAVTDSTPLIRRFETEVPGRSALPDHPVTRFLQDVIEDYADEWVTKIMFHYRWAIEENAEFVTPLLIYWTMPEASPDVTEKMGSFFAKRQIDRLRYVGSNEVTKASIEGSYLRLIQILDDSLQKRRFLFGARPSAADFALHGQLTQIISVEPTSSAIARQKAPRLRGWIDHTEDASGYKAEPDGWLDVDQVFAELRPLLEEIGHTYAPLCDANAKACATGQPEVSLKLDGRPWVQNAFPYQAKCLRVLRASFAELSAEDQARVTAGLAGTGCEIFCAPAD